jgi:phenylacetic acid degradation operon negative regulatory protein
MMGPAHKAEALPQDGVAFAATPLDTLTLSKMVAAEWDFVGWDTAYQQFLDLFAPLDAALASGQAFDDRLSLQSRLLLVHAYRLAALRDPHLPREALPEDWSGAKARALFASLYLQLSPRADQFAGTLHSVNGELPSETPIVQRRRETLLLSQQGG